MNSPDSFNFFDEDKEEEKEDHSHMKVVIPNLQEMTTLELLDMVKQLEETKEAVNEAALRLHSHSCLGKHDGESECQMVLNKIGPLVEKILGAAGVNSLTVMASMVLACSMLFDEMNKDVLLAVSAEAQRRIDEEKQKKASSNNE